MSHPYAETIEAVERTAPALHVCGEWAGTGLPMLELRPRGESTFPVLWYDTVLNDRPQVGVYDTLNDFLYGECREMLILPAGLDTEATAAVLVTLAETAASEFNDRHGPIPF